MSEGHDGQAATPLSAFRTPDAVELRHLRAFVAVAEELNFGRAAARLYLSQPALSRQIRALERLVGCALLRRSTHLVELTLCGDDPRPALKLPRSGGHHVTEGLPCPREGPC